MKSAILNLRPHCSLIVKLKKNFNSSGAHIIFFLLFMSFSFLSLLFSLFSLLCPVVRHGLMVRVVVWWVWVWLDGSMVMGGGSDDLWSAIMVWWAWVMGPTVQLSWWRFGVGCGSLIYWVCMCVMGFGSPICWWQR